MARIALLPSTQKGNPVLGGGSEADYAQDIARKLIPLLKDRGHQCASFAGVQDANSDGANAAVAWKPDFSFSIHSDAGYDHNSHNAALMCYQSARSKPYAETVLKGYCSRMNFTSRGLQVRTPGTNGVAVIRIPETVCPAILLEATWHDRDPDASNLRDSNYRNKMATAMCGALTDYIGGTTPVQKEDDGMLYRGSGNSFRFEDCFTDRYSYWMHVMGHAANLRFKMTQLSDMTSHISEPQNTQGHTVHNLQLIAAQKPIKGSYCLTCTADGPVDWALREVPR